MIRSAKGPLDPTARELRGLYVSLNSPVISVAPLPVGPASAAVALHPPPAGGATLAIRSVRTGGVAFFTVAGCAPGLREDPDSHGASEAALVFAESLGFLFDEGADGSASAGASPGIAAARWREWIGDSAEYGDDVDPVPSGGREALSAPALSLSKFRCSLPDGGIPGVVASALANADGPEAGLDVRLDLMSRF